MAFAKAEFIDTEVLYFMNRYLSIEALELWLMNSFYYIPADMEIVGDILDGAESQKIKGRHGKGPSITMFANHKGQAWPPDMAALNTGKTMKM